MATSVPEWDLSDLYESIQDPEITRDKKSIERRIRTFRRKYDGAITAKVSVAQLAEALSDYSEIISRINVVSVFAGLQFAVNKRDHTVAAFMQSISEWETEMQQQIVFFYLAIASLPKTVLKKLANHTQLLDWKHWLEKQVDNADHVLTEKEEGLLLETSLTGRDAFVRLFQEESSRKVFTSPNSKKKILETELQSRLYHPKRAIRKEAMSLLSKGIRNDISRYSFIYNTIMQDLILDTHRRDFKQPEYARHLDNEISPKAVEILVKTVKKHYPLVQDYYEFKRKYMKLSVLYDYDRYAPIASSAKKYSYTEAKKIILDAFGLFSDDFRSIATLFFDNNWIDAKPRLGKASGAFCAYATTDTHPYILMNYTGTLNDVMTLAHELGHGIHAFLARKQSPLHYNWPISIAEIASIFAEMIVFHNVKQTLSKRENLALHAAKMETIIASVFRQIAMFEFERKSFTMRSKKELSDTELNTIWKSGFAEMYGTAVRQSVGSEVLWSTIPHFFQWPFYVYAYAFGDLLTRSLFALYEQDGSGFVATYLNMLEFGGSKSPDELLQPFGANVESVMFWKGGMQEIKRLLEETRNLA